jgi:hypothetical protein
MAYNYIPTGQPGADVAAQQNMAFGQGSGMLAQLLANPMASTLLRNFMNDPTIGGLESAAGQAGQVSGQVGQQQVGQGTALNQQIMAALPQFQQILQQGTDPQGALYARTQQQVRDQQNAQLANMGLQSSPAGAGIADKGLSDFNIDWQNQQLARALSAMQGYGGAMGQAGTGLGQGAALQQGGIGDIAAAGALPYQAGQTAMGGQQKALSDFLSAMSGSQNIGNQSLQQLLSYLQTGQSANQLADAAAQGNLTQTGTTNAAAAGAISPLISGAGTGLGNMLQQMFGGGGGIGSSTPLPGSPLVSP